ncbi:MAG: hypothetical protein LBQ79_14040 [Deltaproteobacteria bacterium]|jgi:hypothetical protein|nr:hypothetical protein [Deltaproteobacteria bacterium]
MHLPKLAAALAAFTLAIAADGPARAQWTEDGISGFAKKAARPPKASSDTARHRSVSPRCSKSHYDYEVSFPRAIDGGGPVDKAVAARANIFLTQARDNSGVFMSSSQVCGDYSPESSLASFFKVSSSPYRVSSSASSVLFSVKSSMGGAEGSSGFASTNLLSDGTEITLERLFPEPEKSLPLLWASVYGGFCTDRSTMPAFYYFLPCVSGGGEIPPPPEPLKSPDATLDGAGHAVLTSLGLSVHLGDYETYTNMGDVEYLDIPKSDLLAMGADPKIWQ